MFLSSFLGNAVGLAAGLAMGRQCVEFDDLATDVFASNCDQLTTAGSGIAAITLPLAGGALGARMGGGTPISHGRFFPAMASGAIALLPGYAMVSASQENTTSPSFRAGQLFGLLGIPVAVTLADRLFRKCRED